MKLYNLDKVKDGLKRDIVTTRVFFDPLAIPLVCFFSRFSAIQPNHLTLVALFFGVLAALFFALGHPLAGGGMYYLFFLCDRMDGTLARATGCFHPLGKFYDFVVDRNTVWLMSMGMAFSFWQNNNISVAALYLVYLSLFLLKDIWAHEISSVLPLKVKKAEKTERKAERKTHFKPGQVLSCHLAFLFAPITNHYYLFVGGAIICVLFSIGINGVLPLIRLYRKYGLVLVQNSESTGESNE